MSDMIDDRSIVNFIIFFFFFFFMCRAAFYAALSHTLSRPAKSHGISVSLQKSLLISRSH